VNNTQNSCNCCLSKTPLFVCLMRIQAIYLCILKMFYVGAEMLAAWKDDVPIDLVDQKSDLMWSKISQFFNIIFLNYVEEKAFLLELMAMIRVTKASITMLVLF